MFPIPRFDVTLRVVLVSSGLSLVGCASDGKDDGDLRPSQRRVTARVVDIRSGEPVPPIAGQTSYPSHSAQAAGIESDEFDVPREVPVITTTSVESGGSQVVREERSGRPQPIAAARPPAVEPPSVSSEEQFMLRVAWDRPAVPQDGTINGEAAVVGYVSGEEGCSRLGVTYPERRVSEIWRVCADRQFTVDRKAEPTPSVPDDPSVEASRMFAVQSAYNEGSASTSFGPWSVSAQTGGPQDARGCVPIRSALSWEGIPVATRDETICRPVED